MFHVLTYNILPIFSMLALGFALGRFGKVSRQEATALNRIAFLVLQPALIFPLINGLTWSEFRVDAIALYAACQAIVFTAAYLVARRILRRDTLESWLLAMATIFVNTLLYIWPISFLIYGEVAALPITGLVAWDASFTFAFFIVTTDVLANRQAAPLQSLRRVAVNPVLVQAEAAAIDEIWAGPRNLDGSRSWYRPWPPIALGVLTNALRIPMPEPVRTAMQFAGAGASPLTLFALGVILSGHALRPSATIMSMSALKLLAFPALVFLALHLGQRPPAWNTLLVLGAAGPSGAMAFALAMLHGVRTDQIAPVIIWASALSLLSLSWLA